MKPIEGRDKLRGGYYTPPDITNFIVKWAIRAPQDTVLEPSCGDGRFLAAIQKQDATYSNIPTRDVTGVELDSVEAKKASLFGYSIINDDFFSFYQRAIDGNKKYDVVIGNPPFIRYQSFDEKYRAIAFSLMKRHGFHPNRLTNIWLPFLLLSCEALNETGRIGMVIPAELFQVDYAAEARNFLSSFFDSIVLITFKNLVFNNIQQEVILLLGEKKSIRHGIRIVELDGLNDLNQYGLSCLNKAENKDLDHGNEKWTKYFLSNKELAILRKMNSDSRIANACDLYEVNVGLVSGENDFFLSNWNNVITHNLQDSFKPIISRAEQVRGVSLSEEEYNKLKHTDKRVSIFMPEDSPFEKLEKSVQEYIRWGEQNGFNKNFKCRMRKRWYIVPNSWTADAFLIRQANLYPKMILNPIGALVTDTLHKVRFHKGINGQSVVSAFLNTYTLALSETLGRSYGGGVLTFEPGEMRRLRIPMQGAEKINIQIIDNLQRAGKIEEILAYTDEILLYDGLGMNKRDVALLHSIWNKMRERRLQRKQRCK